MAKRKTKKQRKNKLEGILTVFFDDIKNIVTRPGKFFSNIQKKSFRAAMVYYAIVLIIMFLLACLIILPFALFFGGLLFLFLLPAVLIGFILGFIIRFALMFVISFVHYLLFMIFKGKASLEDTVKVNCYARGPEMLRIIPFINILAWIYQLVLLIIGLKKINKTGWIAPIVVVLLPIIILFLLIALLYFFLFAAIFATQLAAMGGSF